MTGLASFNEGPAGAVREDLAGCCASARWVDAVMAGRPYPSVEALLAASDAAVAGLSEADLGEALAGHPRIGDQRVLRASGQDGAGWSGGEQAGVRAAGDDLLRELAAGNAEYERRFGHIYLACATGRSAPELLALLRERLGNSRETEWRVVASELAKINRIRLRKLIAAEASGGEAPGDEVRAWGLTNSESISGRAAGGGLASDEIVGGAR
jgi:2-oxo-4-hydroxy-4-carboxy-5-ureidoimidazoline decarboxylase